MGWVSRLLQHTRAEDHAQSPPGGGWGGIGDPHTQVPLPPSPWSSALGKKPEKILCPQVMSSLVREGIHLCDGSAVGNRGTALEKNSEKSIKSTRPLHGVQAAAAGPGRAWRCHHALSCATCKPRAHGPHHDTVLPKLFPPFSTPRLSGRTAVTSVQLHGGSRNSHETGKDQAAAHAQMTFFIGVLFV